MVSKDQKAEIVKNFGGKATNTGDTSVQIAIITSEIKSLEQHFAQNPKDLHSKRGFIAKIEKRKRLLKYLKKIDFDKYQDTINRLKIRK